MAETAVAVEQVVAVEQEVVAGEESVLAALLLCFLFLNNPPETDCQA